MMQGPNNPPDDSDIPSTRWSEMFRRINQIPPVSVPTNQPTPQTPVATRARQGGNPILIALIAGIIAGIIVILVAFQPFSQNGNSESLASGNAYTQQSNQNSVANTPPPPTATPDTTFHDDQAIQQFEEAYNSTWTGYSSIASVTKVTVSDYKYETGLNGMDDKQACFDFISHDDASNTNSAAESYMIFTFSANTLSWGPLGLQSAFTPGELGMHC